MLRWFSVAGETERHIYQGSVRASSAGDAVARFSREHHIPAANVRARLIEASTESEVMDERAALAAYWAAETPEEERAAYRVLHERFGYRSYGEDGMSPAVAWWRVSGAPTEWPTPGEPPRDTHAEWRELNGEGDGEA